MAEGILLFVNTFLRQKNCNYTKTKLIEKEVSIELDKLLNIVRSKLLFSPTTSLFLFNEAEHVRQFDSCLVSI